MFFCIFFCASISRYFFFHEHTDTSLCKFCRNFYLELLKFSVTSTYRYFVPILYRIIFHFCIFFPFSLDLERLYWRTLIEVRMNHISPTLIGLQGIQLCFNTKFRHWVSDVSLLSTIMKTIFFLNNLLQPECGPTTKALPEYRNLSKICIIIDWEQTEIV